MKSVKYLVILVCMTLGLANVAKAQIYHNNDEVVYYRSSSGKGMRVVRFDGDKVYIYYNEYDGVKQKLKNNPEYYDNFIPKHIPDGICRVNGNMVEVSTFDFDHHVPNSSKAVYIQCNANGPGNHYLAAHAFSEDLSTLVYFHVGTEQEVYKPSGNIYYFIRIAKEDLFPNVNPNDFDFLND